MTRAVTRAGSGRAIQTAVIAIVLALLALGCPGGGMARGPQGEQGPQGERGPKGDRGDPGAMAEVGRRGAGHHRGFESDQETVQIISTNIQGKNVFLPATIVVTAPGPVTLQIHNTTEYPHGFNIDGLDVQHIVEGGRDLEVVLTDLVGHRVYHVECHLHKPHRSATLVVLPGGH